MAFWNFPRVNSSVDPLFTRSENSLYQEAFSLFSTFLCSCSAITKVYFMQYNKIPNIEHSSYIRPTLCLFPFGTANALFHSIHLRSLSQALSPSDITTALHTLLTG